MGALTSLLQRSDTLEKTLDVLLDGFTHQDNAKNRVTVSMCAIAFEHGQSLKMLIAERRPTSAVGLLRMQYECLLRAAWLLHAASEDQVSTLETALSPDSERATKNMPHIAQMLSDLSERGPRGAARLLIRFRDRLWSGLNSFVHGGIHAVRRKAHGYPEPMLCDLVKSSNALSMLSLVVLAELSGDAELASYVGRLNKEFCDCVPAMEPFQEG
jgi:hypothetical protein